MALPPRVRRLLIVMGLAAAVLGAAAVGASAWHSASLNRWADEDAGDLSPLPHVLLKDGARVVAPKDRELDAVLVPSLTKDRLAVDLTRSEYRRNLLRTHAWVKVHLVTRNPAAPDSSVPIKLLTHLAYDDGTWRVEDVREIALP